MDDLPSKKWVVYDDQPVDRLNTEMIGAFSIFRPRLSNEAFLRVGSEEHLRSKYKPGLYYDKKIINEILQFQFNYYSKQLDDLLPSIASLEFLILLLGEYDKTAEIDLLYKQSRLNKSEMRRWAELGPTVRRSIKYLAERVVLFLPEKHADLEKHKFVEIVEKVWICAEELVNHYVLSDQTFMIFPDETTFEIYPPSHFELWDLKVRNKCAYQQQDRMRVDTHNREEYISSSAYDLNTERHEEILSQAFESTIGISYRNALTIIKTIVDNSEPADDSLPIPFINRRETIDNLANYFKYPIQAIENAIKGFSICKTNLENENRQIWRPKQEHRAFRRGFFEIPHSSGTHLIFSKAMAKENAIQLMGGVAFQDLPTEWTSNKVKRSLLTVSNEAGNWLEKLIFTHLTQLGFNGLISVNQGIGRKKNRILIPPDVGEIDFIGYSPKENLLCIIESKMVRGGTEPSFFRDEIDKFTLTTNPYFSKFEKKINWAQSNMNSIASALKSIHICDELSNPTRIAAAIVTFYPSIVSCFTTNFPCVTITEIITGYNKSGVWPYTNGVYSCQES